MTGKTFLNLIAATSAGVIFTLILGHLSPHIVLPSFINGTFLLGASLAVGGIFLEEVLGMFGIRRPETGREREDQGVIRRFLANLPLPTVLAGLFITITSVVQALI